MKYYFPDPRKGYTYLQTNRSDDLGSIWSSFNLDFQTNLGVIRSSPKLVINTSSTDDADLSVPSAFEFFSSKWWALAGGVFATAEEDITDPFTQDTSRFQFGDGTTQFDITNPAGTTFRYTYDGTGTDPDITAATFAVGQTVVIASNTIAAGNRGTFTITGSGANYFEVTNASGVVESNKVIGTGSLSVTGGSISTNFGFYGSDLKAYNGSLWATAYTASSLNDKIYKKTSASGNWVPFTDLGLSSIHKMVVFDKFEQLYYIESGSQINSIDTEDVIYNSGTGDYSLSLTASDGFITCMDASSTAIWIGTTRTSNSTAYDGSQGQVLVWDGQSAQVSEVYTLPTAGVVAICVYNNIPYAVDSEGRILKYSGYSFEEIARLPINRMILQNSTVSIASSSGVFVHFNGFAATKNNTLLVSVRNLNDDGTFTENLPSGIWELDLATGNFTHRYSFTLKTLASTTVSDYGHNLYSWGNQDKHVSNRKR